MIKNKLLLLLFVTVFISCKTLKHEDIIGEYKHEEKMVIGKFILQDSLFSYQYNVLHDSYESNGTWKLQGNQLILKSFDSYKNDYIKVEEQSSEKVTYIQLLDKNNYPMEGFDVLINDKYSMKVDSLGKADLKQFTDSKIQSIKVPYIGLSDKSNFYIPESPSSNTFIIHVFDIDYGKVFFDNESIKVKRNTLIIKKKKYTKLK